MDFDGVLLAQGVGVFAIMAIAFVVGYAYGQNTVIKALDAEAEIRAFRVQRRRELTAIAQDFYNLPSDRLAPGQNPDAPSFLDCQSPDEVEVESYEESPVECDDAEGTEGGHKSRRKRGMHVRWRKSPGRV